jgi:hypothetical protein
MKTQVNTKTHRATTELRDKVSNHLRVMKPLETKFASIDSVRDFADILQVCQLILDGERADMIESKFRGLDTVVRGAFPLSIFDKNGSFKG